MLSKFGGRLSAVTDAFCQSTAVSGGFPVTLFCEYPAIVPASLIDRACPVFAPGRKWKVHNLTICVDKWPAWASKIPPPTHDLIRTIQGHCHSIHIRRWKRGRDDAGAIPPERTKVAVAVQPKAADEAIVSDALGRNVWRDHSTTGRLDGLEGVAQTLGVSRHHSSRGKSDGCKSGCSPAETVETCDVFHRTSIPHELDRARQKWHKM